MIGGNIDGSGLGNSPDDEVTSIDATSLVTTAGTQGFETITFGSFDIKGWHNFAIRFTSTNIDARSGGTNREQVYIDNLSVVPEPSTIALFAGLSALGLILYRRRRG